MDVRIGLAYSARELELELADDTDVDALRADVEQAMAGDGGTLWLTDRKGARIAVSGSKLTFVSLGTGTDRGRIGFG